MQSKTNDHYFLFVKGKITPKKPHTKKAMWKEIKFFLAVILVFIIIYTINQSSSRITVKAESLMLNIFSKR